MAVLHTFMTATIPGRSGRKLAILLLTNTTVAIVIGLLVANIVRPGTWRQINKPAGDSTGGVMVDPWSLLQNTIPDSVLKPLVDNNVIQLIVIALTFGIALRALKSEQTRFLPQ